MYDLDDCLQEYYNSLEEKVKEQESIINWLAYKLVDKGISCDFGKILIIEGVDEDPYININRSYQAFLWYKAAQEAVKKNV